MACPTCDHTMQNLGLPQERVFWCPRCGTLKTVDGNHEEVSLPTNLRRMIEKADLHKPMSGVTQSTSIRATHQIKQRDRNPPQIEQVLE